jgi:hypothetical protein
MSLVIVKTSQELKSAIESEAPQIRVEGVLADKIKRTMLIPKASFAIGVASASVAIYSLATAHEEIVYAPLTGGTSSVIRFGAGTAATVTTVALLGTTTAWALIGVGIALGGIGAVKSLRNKYKIQESGPNFVILVKT